MDPVTLGMAKADAARRFATNRQATIVVEGDSRTADGFGKITTSPTARTHANIGYWTWASRFLRNRVRLVGAYAVGGSVSADVLARIGNSAAHRPAFFLMEIGVNDFRAAAGTGDSAIPAAVTTLRANVQAIIATMKSAGSKILLLTVRPYTFGTPTATMKQAIRDHNRWLYELSAADPSIVVIDSARVYTDPTSGDPISGVLRDGLHDTQLGASRIGRLVADALSSMTINTDPQLPVSNADTGLIITNGLMVGNTSGLATDWVSSVSSGVSVTYSKLARTDGIPGEWQQAVVSGVASAATDGGIVLTIERNINSGLFAIGDDLYAVAEVEVDNDVSNLNAIKLRAEGKTSGYALTGYAEDGDLATQASEGYPASAVAGRIIMSTPSWTVVDTTAVMQLRVYFRGNGTFRLGRNAIYKGTRP
ncbi:hypothetical protein PP504_gp29 [Gordonia phage Dolores]|uniref:SGNH hydrolase-type esterase domain-containing protein n=1 Tax=Gordonia phage Dolores TaxID=2873534 RepID=A0AAE8XB90_9CAUD|nr:hypothetical protein PP504_gp29 [Gordonia phage Dolores]UAJ16460.1 hypothetical protein SEA_DOLORES_29 [Gordonia phage Dolores]